MHPQKQQLPKFTAHNHKAASGRTSSLHLFLSLPNLVVTAILCSYRFIAAETQFIPLNQQHDKFTETAADSFVSSTTHNTLHQQQQSSKCNTPCLYVDGPSLQPLPATNCRQYVLCQDYSETYRYTCPDGQRFNNDVKKCVVSTTGNSSSDNGPDVFDCKCALDELDESTLMEREGRAICSLNKNGGEYDGTSGNDSFPLNECKEFVKCRRNGSVREMGSCKEGFLFDSILGVCNWKDRVECSSSKSLEEGQSNFFASLTFGDVILDQKDEMETYQELAGYENMYCAQTAGSDYAIVPLPGCAEFVSCYRGKVVQKQTCAEGLIFDSTIGGCNWDYMTTCNVFFPPSKSPTKRPTFGPTVPPPTKQPVTPKPVITNRPTPQPVPQTGKPITYRPISESPTSSDAFPRVLDYIQDHVTPLNEQVFRSYSKEGLSYRSYWFQFTDFIKALKLVSEKSITGDKRHIFYLGDNPTEWEYGLVNVAAFLSQAMTESIAKDACDEFNWEANTDDYSDAAGNGLTKPDEHYATSNACGQGGLNYQEFHCSADESHMECSVDRNMKIQATTGEVYPNAPPPLTCRPRTTSDSFTGFWDVMVGKESVDFPYENSFGRTDVEGCCFWGRGAIHTKGICNLGKLNYYLGKQAAKDGRPSRYPTVDFCGFPEAICAGPESREMRWVTSFFEWTERIQAYDDGKGWNYIKELKKFVDSGLYDMGFSYAVSALVSHGCHDPPCKGANAGINGGFGAASDVRVADERSTNFQTALMALGAGGEKAMIRALTNFLSDNKEVMNSQILQSQTPEGQLYPSYRYQLSDFLSALTIISSDGVAGKKFYVGDTSVAIGVRYGIVNAVMFLAQSYKEAIQYDACDENNWLMVNDRFPISNSCGQLGMSYQDMHCPEEEAHMECPVKPEMEQYALTSALWFQAPGPFKCGPKSKFPVTGYWDYSLGKENNEDAYANDRGRVDVEGCCWWGRGVIQTRGVCNYGKLNFYLGARAAREGRKSLYPTIDFCEFPQGVCSSDETYGGELQWMVGLFEWVDRIQSYDKDGWNYIEELKLFADSGYTDFEFVDRVSSILNLGCHSPPCAGISPTAREPHNQSDRNDVFQRFLNQLRVVYNFPAPPPPTPLPTPFPTEEPSIVPTTNSPTEPQLPTTSPTISPAPTSLAGRPPKKVATSFIEDKVAPSKEKFEDVLLLSEYPYGKYPSYIYTWKSFLVALEKMTSDEIGPGPGNWFYIGEEYTLDYGLVNLAAFLAYGVTQSIHYDSCDENNWEVVDFRYPLSNSCGQGLEGGLLYEEQVCTDEDEGLECEVDEEMEIYGVTHASWIGAPQPLYCGDKSTGYWDHVTGLERNDQPFKSAAGRSDVRGCCWWGRGVLQVRGVCQYGKLNHYLGAKGATSKQQTMYPDIDFCKNPGAICSDKRAPELRWVTGMFYWANQVQRNRMNFDYMNTLKDYVNSGDLEDSSFIDSLNLALGGSLDIASNRTRVFFDALRTFGLIEEKIDTIGNSTNNYCGLDIEDAGSKCSILCGGSFFDPVCPEGENCYLSVEACTSIEANETISQLPSDATILEGDGNSTILEGDGNITILEDDANSTILEDDANSTNSTLSPGQSENTTDTEVDTQIQFTAIMVESTSTAAALTSTNYCGSTWSSAATECGIPCPSGKDGDCPPNQFCFAEITSCASISLAPVRTNWCGKDWNDATSCYTTCPSGLDSECPPPTRCFADITTC